ncbi:helix-turn-helix transcriptional regulator [Merdibacter massiliensis]|uniref:helix-turn-helix transcriptional regulator n=1 Tax=Merdibacter massiliensis TaxID=1871030 RepID=UPI00096AA977|nr:WYL domain-containing protein [Merdibacter massiliensis]
MNRSALCIRMLQLLKTRGRMKINELAEALETNPRNISEFRKELETAGYVIKQTRGRYGGYELIGDVLLPSLALKEKEEGALREADDYLRSHSDFVHYKSFSSAVEKILANEHGNRKIQGTYVFSQQPNMSKEEKEYVDRCMRAIQNRLCAQITYRPLSDAHPYTILIQPYEILYYQGACYCLAYSLKAHDFRIFRFSDQRMFQFTIQSQTFKRDSHFALEKYIGENGLIKGQFIFARFVVKGVKARTLAERPIGVSSKIIWKDDQTLFVEAWMESSYSLMELMLKLGKAGELLEPGNIRERLREECEQMLSLYTS